MRTPRLALAASAALVATLFALPSAAAEPTTTNGCISSVPETAGGAPVKICYSIHKPASASKDNKVPMVMQSHGWGGSRSTSASSFSSWLDKGFGILSFDQRGFGESGGKAHVQNPDFEGTDVIKLVDLIADLDWVRQNGKNDPVLGAIGGSYGGGYQFLGAFTELERFGKTRFDALAPEITWFDLKESLAPVEVPRTTWTAALYAAGLASDAHTDTVHKGLAYSLATGMWNGPVPGADLDAFFLKNGPKWHISQGRQLDIPVLFGQGATDNLFPLAQGLKNYDQALTEKARKRSIFVGYNGGHVLPNAFPAGVGTTGDPCSKKVGGGSFALLSQRFLQENLLGLETGLTGFSQYHLATVDNACVTVDSVQPNQTVTLPQVVSTTAAGVPLPYELAKGPISVAGAPSMTAAVTALGAETRAFVALSVGTSPADAKVIQNNVMPIREALPVVGAQRTIELPAVAVDVPAGKTLFLTISPISDMFVGHGSRTPGALLLQNVKVSLPTR